MNYLRNRGITIPGVVFTAAIGVTIALIGAFTAMSNKIVDEAEARQKDDAEIAQRLAKTEEAIATIKNDNTEIKNDIKQILREIRAQQ